MHKLPLTLLWFFYLQPTVGYDITGEDIKDILFGNATISVQEIASNAFIEFEDISANFVGSARLNATLNLADAADLQAGLKIENANAAVGLGIGMEESKKIYFNAIDSVLIALRDSSWRKVAVLDASLPIIANIELGGLGDLTLAPIVAIRSKDLFGPDLPSISVDFDVK